MKIKKIELKGGRIIIAVVVAVVLFFGLPFLFVGNILEQGNKQSEIKEKARIQKILDEDPDFAETYLAWQNGELELTRGEIEEQIYSVLYPETFE